MITHDSFVIARAYPVPPARVFRAFADPELHERWFVQGEGFAVAEYAHDFRVGGREHGRFSTDKKTFIVNQTTYFDIVPDERIVLAYSMGIETVPFSTSLATIELKTEGVGTRLVYTEHGAYFDGADGAAMRKQGWNQLLDALGRELAGG